MSEAFAKALAKHEEEERRLLDKVEREALNLERLPEGEEPRDQRVIVDGITVRDRERRRTITLRW